MALLKPCSFCGQPSDGIHREVTGWVAVRRSGGANHFYAKKETGRVACASCAYDIRHGLTPNTPKLFMP